MHDKGGKTKKEKRLYHNYSIIIDTGVAYWLLAHMTLSKCLSSIRKGGF